MSLGLPIFLNSGNTLTNFHHLGYLPVHINLLYISISGFTIWSATLFIIKLFDFLIGKTIIPALGQKTDMHDVHYVLNHQLTNIFESPGIVRVENPLVCTNAV